jgi:hypothetical protein
VSELLMSLKLPLGDAKVLAFIKMELVFQGVLQISIMSSAF